MKILQKNGGVAATNSFLIVDEETRKAVIFDAPDSTVFPLLQRAKESEWDVIGLWLTHGHFDHIADHKLVTDHFPKARVLIHPLDEPKLLNPFTMFIRLPFKVEPRSADAHVQDGQTLELGNMKVEVIHTPGHAPGHVMYHFPEYKTLVGGDLIIGGAVGRTDFPDSNEEDLWKSVRRVMRLPPDTRLLPGHGNPTLLREEMANNPYVQRAMSGISAEDFATE